MFGNNQWQEVVAQVPEGERIIRSYTAVEGDFRVITTDGNIEKRYTVDISDPDRPVLKGM